MKMKSWGVRLGMAGVTALLGILAIAQAQRDRLSLTDSESSSVVDDLGPPTPIPMSETALAGMFDAPGLSTPPVARANDDELGAVQPVGHQGSEGSPTANPISLAIPPISSTSMPSPPAASAYAAPGTNVADNLQIPNNESTASGLPALSLPLPPTTPSVGGGASAPAAAPLSGSALSVPAISAPAISAPALGAPTLGAQSTGDANPIGTNPIGSGVPQAPAASRMTVPAPSNALRSADAAAGEPAPLSMPEAPAATPLSLPAPPDTPAARPSTTAANARETAPEARPASIRRDAMAAPMQAATEPMPGESHLEGAQTPSVLIHKKAPVEVKVGQPAMFVIQVRNTGSVKAFQVRVQDQVPRGMRLVDATPQAEVVQDQLSWNLGDIEPGGERAINLRLVPEAEGELGSVARVSFEAAASVRTVATRPELRIKQAVPPQVLIGQQLEINIEVSNPGTGTATAVEVQADIPPGLEHPKGRELTMPIGDLEPGQSKKFTLRLMAVQPGVLNNVIRLSSGDGVSAEDSAEIEVTAPQLALELQGPSRRFLERQANFELLIGNAGTAPATNVEIVAYLDRGFTFVSTEYKGQYDPNRHAVYWSLAELPPGQNGTVPLRLLPIEAGSRVVRLEARGDLGVKSESEKSITVEALAELTFSVADQHDPIEVGSETTYEIRVTNNGSRDDTNVQLQVELPPGLDLVAAEPSNVTVSGRTVAFAPLAHIDAKGEYSFKLKVRGDSAGAHIVRAVVTSDASKVPVMKEEKTLVYDDQ